MGHLNIDNFNQMLEVYHDNGFPELDKINSFEEFICLHEVKKKEQLKDISEHLMNVSSLQECYIVGTSGSTGKQLFLASHCWPNAQPGSFPYDMVELLAKNVFSPSDVVVNLLVPGGFSLLHEGLSKYIEAIAKIIFSVGRLDMQEGSELSSMIKAFARAGANTLLATPAGVLQFAKIASTMNIDVNIEKVIFIGEHFHLEKMKYILSIWPNVKFYGLYGTTEIGLIGFSTPDHPYGVYDIPSKWFFIEQGDDQHLIITDLRTPPVPMIRYDLGDRCELIPTDIEDTIRVKLIERSDGCFSFCGNLVGYEMIRDVVWSVTNEKTPIQITLHTDFEGIDSLSITGDFNSDKDLLKNVEESISRIPYLSEGVERGIARLAVLSKTHLNESLRQKTPLIIDLR